jgi:hypothetical protein
LGRKQSGSFHPDTCQSAFKLAAPIDFEKAVKIGWILTCLQLAPIGKSGH